MKSIFVLFAIVGAAVSAAVLEGPQAPLEDRLIGDECLRSSDCPGENSHCPNDPSPRCACDNGFVPMINRTDCLPILDFGDRCLEPQQCQQGPSGELSDCFYTCDCKFFAVKSENQTECLPLVEKVNGDCVDDVQCMPERSTCKEGKCACPPGTIESYDHRRCAGW